MLICFLRLLPSDLQKNKHEQPTPFRREPSVCLFPLCEYWRYSKKREQEQKLNIYIISTNRNAIL